MRFRALLLSLGAAVVMSACASSDQWTEWRQHSTHFASGEHLRFSFRNRGEHPTPRVRRVDLERSRDQAWWGEPVLVRPDQLFAADRP
ncbi:MAG TPA: hypothetical protein VGW35_04125 [Methylomirabilota bacterium]|jgi:hypothetical protein|nr:hypothetical protein [Methylomirabilota bacterium]